MSRFLQPTREQLEGFRDGDPIAIDDVISIVLPQVTRWAIASYTDIPEQEAASVVNQVFAEISVNHQRYDPSQALFTTYAINLIKLRMIDQRQHEYELKQFEGADLEDHENQVTGVYNDLEEQFDRSHLLEVVYSKLNDLEREFLNLMREGEKRNEIFIEVLQRHQHVNSSKREVDTIKERIKRRLNSSARDLGFDQDTS